MLFQYNQTESCPYYWGPLQYDSIISDFSAHVLIRQQLSSSITYYRSFLSDFCLLYDLIPYTGVISNLQARYEQTTALGIALLQWLLVRCPNVSISSQVI
jgi:hypothetical protein